MKKKQSYNNVRKSGIKLSLLLTFGLFALIMGALIPLYSEPMGVTISESQVGAPLGLPQSSSLHAPISIYGDDWSVGYPEVNGSGTYNDPYVIANITIDAGGSDGIFILNSQAYGTIQNCTIFNGTLGIKIWDSSNCLLIGNSVSDTEFYGIGIMASSNCSVIGNTATNNSAGIFVQTSINCTITENTVTNSFVDCLDIRDSSNCTISMNDLNGSNQDGIYFYSTPNSTISGNTIHNTGQGISIYFSYDCEVSGNSIVDSEWEGIRLLWSNSCMVRENSLLYIPKYGVTITADSYDNLIVDNLFVKNIEGTVLDEGINTSILGSVIITFVTVLFEVSSSSIIVGDLVNFTDNSTGGHLPLQFSWNFGDTTTSSLQNPSHSYNMTGSYTVSLTVTDSDGDTASYSTVIEVLSDDPPEDLTDDPSDDLPPKTSIPSYPMVIFGLLIGLGFGILVFNMRRIRLKS